MRRSILAAAVFSAALLVTLAPVAMASSHTALVVGSQHTTDTDFNNADTLDNVTVDGSGNGASVVLETKRHIIDDFEDGDITTKSSDWDGWTGDTAEFSATSTNPISGSFSGRLEGTGSFHKVETTRTSETTKNFTFTFNSSSLQENDFQLFASGSAIGVLSTDGAGDINWEGNDIGDYSANTNVTIKLDWDFASDQVTILKGGSVLDTRSFRQSSTGLLDFEFGNNAGSSDFTLIDDVYTESGGAAKDSGQYIGDNHTVENAKEGFTNLTLANADAIVEWQYHDGNSWNVDSTSTFSTTANHTITLSNQNADKWRVNVTFQNKTGSTTAELHDEGVRFTARSPTVDNGSASPTGRIQTSSPSLSINVNDSDFPLAQSDSVTATFYLDGNQAGTDTLNSNGTASLQVNVDAGTHDWNITAKDDYGLEQDSDTFTFSTPENVTFREEHNASKVITGANAEITLYSVDATTIVKRTDSDGDGNISFEGLPDKEFVAVATSDDHYTRRVYIESIFDQQNIFLLNQTVVPADQAINTTFVFEDRTGQFPPENTTLRVQRALDINNDSTFEWLTVAGDFWGAASEFPFTGEKNARYRLVVENRQGQRRVLGTHIPVEDGVKTVINGEIRWDAENATGRFLDAAINRTDSEIEGFYTDPSNTTSEVRVQVWELGNRSNEIYDQNFTSGPYGTIALDPIVALSGDQLDTSWVVSYTYTDTDGNTNVGQVTVGAPQVNLPIDPWLLAAFGVLIVTFVGTLYGPRTAIIGSWSMVMVALGLTVFGLAQFPMASIVLAVMIAGGGTFYREALP